jgi:hypothetical protein
MEYHEVKVPAGREVVLGDLKGPGKITYWYITDKSDGKFYPLQIAGFTTGVSSGKSVLDLQVRNLGTESVYLKQGVFKEDLAYDEDLIKRRQEAGVGGPCPTAGPRRIPRPSSPIGWTNPDPKPHAPEPAAPIAAPTPSDPGPSRPATMDGAGAYSATAVLGAFCGGSW